MKELNYDQLAYFEHMTRPGPPFELIQRREGLRTELAGNRLGSNQKPALLALQALFDMTNPKPTQAQLKADSSDQILKVAQRLYDQGDDAGAQRLLAVEGLGISDLQPRQGGADFAEREEACRTEYRDRRFEAIKNLKLTHQWDDEKATGFFKGTDRGEQSLDAALRRDVNLNHRFPKDRPI